MVSALSRQFALQSVCAISMMINCFKNYFSVSRSRGCGDGPAGRHTRCACFLLLACAVAGCGWFSDDRGFFVNRSDDYIDAREGPALIIPQDMDRKLEDPFPIPPVAVQQNARFFPGRAPLPDAIYADDNREQIRLQRLGERIWLVVPETPATVWPKVKQFLAENGVGIAEEAPRQGRIATEWLTVEEARYRDVVRALLQELKAAEQAIGGRDRLIVQVEQGLRELTSEVHVRHEAVGQPAESAPVDPATSSLADLQPRLLNELGAYIAARVAEQTVSMVAQEIAGRAKSELTRDEASGRPVLRLFLDEERAWATLGQAFNNSGVEVVQLDRSAGLYHIRIPQTAFLGEKEERGFFRRVFSFGGGGAAEVRIRVRQETERTYGLIVEGIDGGEVPFEFAQQVLVLVREYAA